MKEQLAEFIISEGYDFMSAYEIATGIIRDLKSMPIGKHTFVINRNTITIKKGK